MRYQSVQEILDHIAREPIETSGATYHPIPFEEFSHLKTSSLRRGVEKKWQDIEQTLDRIFPEGLKGKNVLDIGANGGFYTFSLARKGAKITAFEPHPRYGPIGEFLAAEKGMPVRWHAVPFDPSLIGDERFDVCLMLSVFQWMADGGARLQEAGRLLGDISRRSKYTLFELGFNSGKSCLRTPKRNHYAALIELLRQHTSYTQFKRISGTAIWADGPRHLVLCSNDRTHDDALPAKVLRSVHI
jgi:SAM-dependent methyltransferase